MNKQALIDDLNEVISFLDYGDIEHADEKLGWMITEICFVRDKVETRLATLRELWHAAPAGFREGLMQYHPAEYAKWDAAMKDGE